MSNEGTIALNNYLQTKDKANLLSWDESTIGPRHEPMWTCVCKIDGQEYGRGTGLSKQTARAAAAKVALERLIESENEAEAVENNSGDHGA